MSKQILHEMNKGIVLGILLFLTISATSAILVGTVNAQQAPLFSATMIASTGNPVRRQYATIIANGMQSMGINARVFYLNFDQLVNRMFFLGPTGKPEEDQGRTFDNGGYDIGFIGWGFTSPVPDFRSNFDGRPAYLAPAGNNYALYNNPQMNAIFDELYKSTDLQKQIDLTKQWETILFHDAPYNYVYAPTDVIPRDQYWTAWGDKNVYNEVTFPDVERWGGGTELTFAEVSNVFPGSTLNPIQSASSNSFYALYIYGAICFSDQGLQYVDGRDNTFHNAIATDVTSSPDGLTWTIKMRQGVLFHSGVEMTADDVLFTNWAVLRPEAASVGLGSAIQYLGNVVDFTWLNGTTTTVDNRATPDEAVRKGTWTALDRYTVQFTMPEVYAFTSQTYAAMTTGILPKHIYEKFPLATWDSQPFSTAAAEGYTYTWDTTQYGGSGSYHAVGPVGAGPYILQSFDFTRNLATLTKFDQFWDRANLEAQGMYSVQTYRVVWIENKDAAIAALKNHEVNVLDYNYQLQTDKQALLGLGMNVIEDVELGWQEMGFNMRHPVLGTGVDTPAGKADPSQAAEAARHIRKAISFLIPRQLIIDQLLAGGGTPLAVCVGPGFGPFYDPTLKADPYDPNMAANELKAAGYSVSITPPAKIASAGTPIMGQSVTVKGYTSVAGMIVIVQESSDQQSWNPIVATVADSSGNYQTSVPGPPAFGTAYYRANFTGYALNETYQGQSFGVDQANSYIDEGVTTGGGPRMVPESVTDPIAISSVTNDAAVVLVVVIVLIVIAVVAMRRRKPPSPATKTETPKPPT
jgi:peptide/nickel transport system substrate-binding protein